VISLPTDLTLNNC